MNKPKPKPILSLSMILRFFPKFRKDFFACDSYKLASGQKLSMQGQLHCYLR